MILFLKTIFLLFKKIPITNLYNMIVNGKNLSLNELKTPNLEELLKKFQLNKNMIAIEINGKIIPKSEWDKVELKEEDKIELIRFVGGG